MELMAELWEVVTVYGKYPLLWIFGVMVVTYMMNIHSELEKIREMLEKGYYRKGQ